MIIPGVRCSLIRHYYQYVHLCRLRGGQGFVLAREFLACRSIERHVPCGHCGFSFYVVLAASGGGRWGPVRGCRPSEAPSALPPDDPAGLVAYLYSHGFALRGFPYAVIPRGLRGLRSGSFLASLGDLPPRRAMPAHAFALHGKLTKMSHRVGCIAY